MENSKIRKINKIRTKISGTPERPRLAVFRSNKFLYSQLIDDTKGETIAFASSKEAKSAEEVGKLLAKKAAEKKIKKAVFDRRGYKYHGNIKALADGARAGGLEI